MRIDRRKFLKASGALAVAGLTSGIALGEQAQRGSPAQPRKIKIGIFDEADFPAIDITAFVLADLERGNRDFEFLRFTRADAGNVLNAAAIDLLLHPYGSAFPVEMFDSFQAYLMAGGKWVNVGGMPLSVPLVFQNGTWKQLDRQPGFYKRLGITAGHPVSTTSLVKHFTQNLSDADSGRSECAAAYFSADTVFELQMPLTRTKSHPDEDGSDGPREIEINPLIVGFDSGEFPRVAPWVELIHRSGAYKHGVWSFTPVAGTISTELLLAQLRRIARKVARVELFPVSARIVSNERCKFIVSIFAPGWTQAQIQPDSCTMKISGGQGNMPAREVELQVNGLNVGNLPFDCTCDLSGIHLAGGLYVVELAIATSEGVAAAKSGFWIADSPLKLSATVLSVGSTHFMRDGKPYPVCGTTYMSSHTHRRFLQEPTPDVWDVDFRQMQEVGITMVRTGIWTGWKDITDSEGVPHENLLRALEAYLLTAYKYDIPVIFTFLAFLPETWQSNPEKTNAFFDPAAISRQKKFIGTFAKRFAGVTNLLWDFINEPSFSSPKQLWNCRPNYDEFEKSAWNKWLRKKYNASSDPELSTILSGVYGLPASTAAELPPLDEFNDVNIVGTNSQARTIDYRLFAQESFSDWTRQMAEVIRKEGGAGQLVTVGQDEGATADRPSPHFFGAPLDFTSMHNWWYNNDLVWDNVMSGVPGKPNLIEETGVMYYEKSDGFPWRTEQEVANLLERKMAISLGAGGAGFIEWIWNTNPYMPSDNEAAIGILRIDGTAKPEFDALRKYAQFFKEHGKLMVGRKQPDVAMIIPHSNLFSPRNSADGATRKCVHALAYDLHYSVQGVSEYGFRAGSVSQRRIFLPAPGILNDQTWGELLKFVSNGGTLVVSGMLEFDEHFHPAARIQQYVPGLVGSAQIAGNEELFLPDGKVIPLTFSGEKIHRVLKPVFGKAGYTVNVISVEHGTIVWSPLPVENADQPEATAQFYEWAMEHTNIHQIETSVGFYDRNVLSLVTDFKSSTMLIIVNESSETQNVDFQYAFASVKNRAIVQSGKTAVCFLDRTDGKILASMGDIS